MQIYLRPLITISGVLIYFLFFKVTYAANFILADQGTIKGGGIVKDSGPEGTEVYVAWTELHGTVLGYTEEKKIVADPGNPARTGSVEFKAPLEIDRNGIKFPVADFQQYAKLPNPGEVSVLDVVAFEPMGNDFLVTPFPDFIRENLGLNVELRIPDLYGDTDSNGTLGEGDTLYSAVNLADYLPGKVTYNIGDSYTIASGSSPLLPGFLFGTQPIIRDANSPNGFINPAPFSGTGTVLTEHLVSTVPEPTSLVMLIAGLGLLGWRVYSPKNILNCPLT